MTDYPSGIAFPFRFIAAGGVGKASGAEKIVSNLKALALSALRERLIRKGVGTIGYEQVMRSGIAERGPIIEGIIREAAVRYEPRALNLEVDVYEREDAQKQKATIVKMSFIFKNTGDPVTMSLELT